MSKLTDNFSFGYRLILNSHGLYLGGQLGVTAADVADRDSHYVDGDSYYDNYVSHGAGLYIGPVFGIKLNISDKIKFDPHIGVSYMHRFQNGYSGNERAHWEVGLGLWINRFLVEVEYAGSGPAHVNTAALLNLGFRF